MKNKKIIIAAVVVVIAAAVFAAAMANRGGSATNMPMDTKSAVATNTVTIKDYMFSPAAIKVKVGTKVTWTNQDSVSHTVTADTNSTDAPSSMDVAQGKSYSFTFNKAGMFAYHCFPHPYMHGTVEVTN